MPTVSIPEVYRAALDKIAFMPEDELGALRDALSRTGVTLKPATLAGQIREQIQNPSSELDDIIQTLVGLSSARAGSDLPVEEFAKDVAKSVGRRKEKLKDYDQAAFEQRLVSLLNIESMMLSARAAEIQHDYERVFASARIVSDIRAVFATSKVEPVGAMIVHNLKVTYFEEGRLREVFLALDNADLVSLRKIIDRADAKTAKLEQVIKRSGVQYFESK